MEKYISIKGEYLEKECEFGYSGMYITFCEKINSRSTLNYSRIKLEKIQWILKCSDYCVLHLELPGF
jgi:hypothetical protein